ncbi:MAG: hypothetical protein RIM84_23500 [Alphaproteobacteria bacterium]
MKFLQARRYRLLHFVLLVALVAVALSTAISATRAADMPANAHARTYGSGWECDRGYRVAIFPMDRPWQDVPPSSRAATMLRTTGVSLMSVGADPDDTVDADLERPARM